ncbi:hypothetical protein D1AOALGA4SA_10497 [Olavius algarvensis Delta 1 endosymbiont]|nr:hypothetical protein D1AOALGA4SA_10497 [Olavius algarvensis Delta 1 endosymbiont]
MWRSENCNCHNYCSGKLKTTKSQISNTKIQTNSKFQNSITKTFTTFESHPCTSLGLPVVISRVNLVNIFNV